MAKQWSFAADGSRLATKIQGLGLYVSSMQHVQCNVSSQLKLLHASGKRGTFPCCCHGFPSLCKLR